MGLITVGIQPIAGVPEMPDYIEDIIRLREMDIPVMDTRLN